MRLTLAAIVTVLISGAIAVPHHIGSLQSRSAEESDNRAFSPSGGASLGNSPGPGRPKGPPSPAPASDEVEGGPPQTTRSKRQTTSPKGPHSEQAGDVNKGEGGGEAGPPGTVRPKKHPPRSAPGSDDVDAADTQS